MQRVICGWREREVVPVINLVVQTNQPFHCPFLTNIGSWHDGNYATGTFAKSGGSLPKGVRLLQDGTLTGTPKSSDAVRIYHFNVKAHTALLPNEPVSKTNPAVTATEPVALDLASSTTSTRREPVQSVDKPSGQWSDAGPSIPV